MKFSNLIYILSFFIISFSSFLISIIFYFDQLNIFFQTKNVLFLNIVLLLLSISSIYLIFSLNKIIWDYPSRRELLRITLFSFISVLTFYLLNFLINRLEAFPRSILLIHTLLNISFSVIFVYKKGLIDLFKEIIIENKNKEKSIIVGISDDVIEFIKINESLKLFNFIHLFDTSKSYQNKNLRSLKVSGFIIEAFKEEIKKISNILIDPNTVDDDTLMLITNLCLKENIRIINIAGILKGIGNTKEQRKIGIENLIPKLEIDSYTNYSSNYISKTVLITGSCGSIGSEITKKLSEIENIFLVCIDTNEEKMMELDLYFKFKNFKNYSLELCNLSNLDVVDRILKKFHPDYCFHAAAMKHVTYVETSPSIAIQVNILHTINLCKLSFKNGIKKFNFISTDKAVNPNNIMGLTKRVAEIYLLNFKKENPEFDIRILRFGNVINSSGSVIPIFKRNIEYNQKLRITHPDIKRYFMSISDAVKLVIIANTIEIDISNKFSIFVLDMGEQIKIIDLAKKFLLINNLSLNKLDKKFIGLRPGEKLYEELNYNYEKIVKTKINNLNGIIYKNDINFVNNYKIEKFLENHSNDNNEIKKELVNLIN